MADDDDDVNKTSSLGWIYVVVSDTRSPGPRQPVPSWLPGSAVAVYGSLLIIVGVAVNAAVTGASLAARRGSTVPVVRRLLAANLAVAQLATAVVVVPAGVVTEALGRWTLGGGACRAWLLGQVLLIAGTMWSVVGLSVDSVLRLAAPRRAYAVLTERHPRTAALVTIFISWVVAGLAALPLGLAVSTPGPENDNAPVLEDVCAVSLSRRDVIAQSLAAFLLPGVLALTGSIATVAMRVSTMGSVDRGPTAVVWVGVACVLLWCPFFVLYTMLPFCGDGLCFSPATWTLSAWIGRSAVVVAPAAWFLDPAVRSDVRRIVNRIRRGCCGGYHGNVTSSASSVYDDSSGLISVAKYQIHRQQ